MSVSKNLIVILCKANYLITKDCFVPTIGTRNDEPNVIASESPREAIYHIIKECFQTFVSRNDTPFRFSRFIHPQNTFWLQENRDTFAESLSSFS